MHNNEPIYCLIVDDEPIAREIIETHLSKIKNIKLVASCNNAMEAFNCVSNNSIDLVFLDINMPEISGISFAKSINSDIKIIFTTAYRNYAVEGFELKAVDYLLKPISFERLQKALETYFDIYTPQIKRPDSTHGHHSEFMFIRSNRKMIKINYDTIMFIESYSDYIKIHTSTKVFVTRETISAIEAKLPQTQFLRIHRSYIIAIRYIKSFTNEQINIHNKSLTISRSYKKNVLSVLEKY